MRGAVRQTQPDPLIAPRVLAPDQARPFLHGASVHAPGLLPGCVNQPSGLHRRPSAEAGAIPLLVPPRPCGRHCFHGAEARVDDPPIQHSHNRTELPWVHESEPAGC
ncbi:hypothetical protein T484DRAFT_1963650 [Baffinella frigidus]|nr:hypothetical protein T484DRAFT_1963650 [Cryptophyta sp. CCMP2293]